MRKCHKRYKTVVFASLCAFYSVDVNHLGECTRKKGLCLHSMTQHLLLLYAKNDMLISQSNASLRMTLTNRNTANSIQEVS